MAGYEAEARSRQPSRYSQAASRETRRDVTRLLKSRENLTSAFTLNTLRRKEIIRLRCCMFPMRILYNKEYLSSQFKTSKLFFQFSVLPDDGISHRSITQAENEGTGGEQLRN